MGIQELTESMAWKRFIAKLYGIGASVVIIGALFKIQHWPGAGIMLTVGLGTEAIIFFFSAFEPVHKEYPGVDWTRVYPELAEDYEEELEDKHHKKKSSGSLTGELDKMLEEAKIGPELIKSLGTGLANLSENANKLANVSNGVVATEEFASKIKIASKSVEDLSGAYNKNLEVK